MNSFLIDSKKPFALLEIQTARESLSATGGFSIGPGVAVASWRTPSLGPQVTHLFFDQAVEEIKTTKAQEVSACLRRLEELAQSGLHLVGYLSYEALESKPRTPKGGPSEATFPLVNFFAFSRKLELSLEEFTEEILPQLTANKNSEPSALWDFHWSETLDSYTQKLEKIKEHLRAGNTYQVNFTMNTRFKWQGSSIQMFLELKKYQPVGLAAFLHFDQEVCSFSPELFLRRDGDLITTKPMKGTARRSLCVEEDQAIRKAMLEDKKTRAENLMIVDLLRNDLGQIARAGSVQVPRLFEIESHATLHQMTSTIQAQIHSQLDFSTIIKALFPCGSITGAPKRRTMEIIQDLEAEPRKIYTGALGYLPPSGDFIFSIAIRTAVLKEEGSMKTGEMGIGSGVVYHSDIQKEWEECHLKSKFLMSINSAFALIETFHYSTETQSVSRLEFHLARLGRSARAFGFQFNEESIRRELQAFLQRPPLLETSDVLKTSSNHRIRLELSFDGHLDLSARPLDSIESYDKIVIYSKPVLKTHVHQQHKTTLRKTYDEAFQRAQELGFDEVLFLNEDGNCAEASRHNLVIKKNGEYWTPPVSDGALPGVYRQTLLEDPKFNLHEKTFDLETLLTAEEIYLCNSVRGLIPVRKISKKCWR